MANQAAEIDSRHEEVQDAQAAPDLRHAGPKVLAFTDRESWHDLRLKTIGASESAALLYQTPEDPDLDDEAWEDEAGEIVSPYASPYELWALKTGKLTAQQAEKESENERTRWGQVLEPVIAETVAQRWGWSYRRPAGYYQHPDEPRIGASLDYEVDLDGTGAYAPFEIKNVAGTERWKWRDAAGEWIVPPWIQIQAQHQMLVTNADRAIVGVLFGGSEDRAFEIERDEEFLGHLVETIRAFWEMVEADEAPPIDWNRDAWVVKKLHMGVDPSDVRDWSEDAEAQEIAAQQRHHAAQKTFHEKEAKRLSAQLQAKLGDARVAFLGDEQMIRAQIVDGAQVSYWREPYKKLTVAKVPKKYAGKSLAEIAREGS